MRRACPLCRARELAHASARLTQGMSTRATAAILRQALQEAPMPMAVRPRAFIPQDAVPRARRAAVPARRGNLRVRDQQDRGGMERADRRPAGVPAPRAQQLDPADPRAPAPLRAAVLRRVPRARRAAVRSTCFRRATLPAWRGVRGAPDCPGPAPAGARWLAETRRSGSRRCRSSTSGGSGSGCSGGGCFTPPTTGPRSACPSGCWRIESRPTYGPTADVSWTGADPTTTLDAARRRGA